MLPPLLRRCSPFFACALFAVGGGLLGGATAVHGLRLNDYGATPAPRVAVSSTQDSVATADTSVPVSSGCDGCSEHTLGFRWATVRGISSVLDCPNDSWDFRRGCADYVNGGGA